MPFFGLTRAQAVEAGVEDFEPARAVTHDQNHRLAHGGTRSRVPAPTSIKTSAGHGSGSHQP